MSKRPSRMMREPVITPSHKSPWSSTLQYTMGLMGAHTAMPRSKKEKRRVVDVLHPSTRALLVMTKKTPRRRQVFRKVRIEHARFLLTCNRQSFHVSSAIQTNQLFIHSVSQSVNTIHHQYLTFINRRVAMVEMNVYDWLFYYAGWERESIYDNWSKCNRVLQQAFSERELRASHCMMPITPRKLPCDRDLSYWEWHLQYTDSAGIV